MTLARSAGRPARPGQRRGRRPPSRTRRRGSTGQWRASIPSTVISAVGTPPNAAAVTDTSAGSGCADSNSRSCRRCSLTSPSAGRLTAAGLLRASLAVPCSLRISLRLEFSGSTPGGLAHVIAANSLPGGEPLPGLPWAGREERHRIMVIRATGPPQNRSPPDSRAVADQHGCRSVDHR